ncbi:hypothetical protein A6A27_40130 [Micromonospora sp. CB01531]|nr:hypothetical protein A6A27_40130 [Micromonospora sp. CB01531]
MCRLVVQGSERRVEVAVPAQVLVADLLPVLLQHLGEGLADAGLAHGGWVLQRLGGPPLDEDSTVAGLGLHDGESLYLRPRSDQIAPADFDDLADGIATGMLSRAGLWRPPMIRWAALASLAVLLGLGLAALAMPGPFLGRALCAAAIAVCCLAAAFALARAAADPGFGMVVAGAGIMYAAVAAMIVPTGGASALLVGGPQVFAGAVAALVTALLATLLVGRGGPFFAAIVTGALLVVLGSGMAMFFVFSPVASAALVAVVATVATVGVPMTSFRLARIHLAPLPTKPEHLQEEIDPEPSAALLAQTASADSYMTGLHAGLGVVTGVALVQLAMAGGWAELTLVGLVAMARLLALRPMTSGWHRLALGVPALAGLAAVAVFFLAEADPLVRLILPIAALPLGATVLFLIARHLPDRRLMPYWGRAGDIVQVVATVAMLPILLAVLGVYAAARALGG